MVGALGVKLGVLEEVISFIAMNLITIGSVLKSM